MKGLWYVYLGSVSSHLKDGYILHVPSMTKIVDLGFHCWLHISLYPCLDFCFNHHIQRRDLQGPPLQLLGLTTLPL
jgi:hypothetical protein